MRQGSSPAGGEGLGEVTGTKGNNNKKTYSEPLFILPGALPSALQYPRGTVVIPSDQGETEAQSKLCPRSHSQ